MSMQCKHGQTPLKLHRACCLSNNFHFFFSGRLLKRRLQGLVYKQLLDKSNCYRAGHYSVGQEQVGQPWVPHVALLLYHRSYPLAE